MLRVTSQIDPDRNVATLSLSGRLDASTVSQLERALSDAQRAGTRTVVVGMEELTYVSSSGLRTLLSARSAARRRGGDVLLCALSQAVREVFDMVGFGTVFHIFDTQAQAHDYADSASGANSASGHNQSSP